MRKNRYPTQDHPLTRLVLSLTAIAFVGVFLVVPLMTVFSQALVKGFDAALDAFKDPDTMASVRLTLLTAAIAVPLNAVFGIAASWAIAKFDFRGRNFVLGVVLAAIVVPSPLLIAPGYQLLYHLHLLDSYWGLLLPAVAPAFGVFLFRQAILNGVPNELLESARIDGCGELRTFFVIVMPLVRPMVGAYLLITFLGTWNNFITPQIVLQDADKLPLSVALAGVQMTYRAEYGMISAGTLLSIAPVAFLFLLLQKEFISGLTSGAIKG